MAYAARAGLDGRWSQRQVITSAGLSERLVRNTVERGLVGRKEGRSVWLSDADVLALRALEVALGLPSPGVHADLAHLRDIEVVRAAHTVWDQRDIHATLIVSATEARLASGETQISAALSAHPDQARTVVPLGRWAEDLRGPLRVP